MPWVPIIQSVSITSMTDGKPKKLKDRIRVQVNDEAVIAVTFAWHKVKPTRTIIPGRCSTLMNVDAKHQYCIAGWRDG